MRTATKITVAGCAAVIAGLVALAAPAVASGVGAVSAWAGSHERPAESPTTVHPTPAAAAAALPTPTPTSGPPACVAMGGVYWEDNKANNPELSPNAIQVAHGTPVDRGKRIGAMGIARLDSHGHPVGYTVAAGDGPMSIGARFCMDYVSILHFNGYWVIGDGKDIAPGDYLYLVPDPRLVRPYQHPTHKPPPA